MNLWGYFIFTAATVFLTCTRQSNGLELSLCFEEISAEGCKIAKNPIRQNSSGSNTAHKNRNSSEAELVLKNGFTNLKKYSQAAEQQALDGLSTASKLSTSDPKAAAKAFQQGVENGISTFAEAGGFVLAATGEALSLTNYTARQGLSDVNQKIFFFALEIFDQLKSLATITSDAIMAGGDSAKQSIKAARQIIQAAFAGMYHTSQITYELANEAISGGQQQCSTIQGNDDNQNANAADEDSDALAAISEVKKLASDSINRGANPSKANQLKKAMISALGDVAQVAADVRDYVTLITKLANTDPSSAKTIYLKKSTRICKRVQEIFSNVLLDLGAAAANSDDSKKQIRSAIIAAGYGNVFVVTGNKLAKHLTLLGLLLEDNERNMTLRAAAESAKYSKIAFNEGIVNASKIAFNSL